MPLLHPARGSPGFPAAAPSRGSCTSLRASHACLNASCTSYRAGRAVSVCSRGPLPSQFWAHYLYLFGAQRALLQARLFRGAQHALARAQHELPSVRPVRHTQLQSLTSASPSAATATASTRGTGSACCAWSTGWSTMRAGRWRARGPAAEVVQWSRHCQGEQRWATRLHLRLSGAVTRASVEHARW